MNNTNSENVENKHPEFPRQRRSTISRLLGFFGLGHKPEEKRQIYEAQFRHPSFRSTIPDSPRDIVNTPDEEAPED